MSIAPFALERYFAKHEFQARYLLSSSDCEGLAMAELIDMAAPETRALWENLRLGYTESQGHPLLRAEIAGLYDRIAPDDVIVAAPEEAIFIAMQTLLAPEDHVIAVSPAYQSLAEVARSMGCRVSPWPLEPGPDGWRLDLDRLEGCIEARTRLLVINFPHNPTGFTLAGSDFDAVVALARRHGLYLFSDEMYRLLEWEEGSRLPPVCDVYEKGVSLSGLSKAFALPGLRVGWLATRRRDWIQKWLAFKDYTTICHCAPGEILGIIGLQNRERIVARNLGIVGANIEIARRFFSDRTRCFSWTPPMAGSVAFPRWLGDGTVERFCRDMMEGKGVMLVPGSLFGFPGDHFRIGLGRTDFGEAIGQVGAFLDDPNANPKTGGQAGDER